LGLSLERGGRVEYNQEKYSLTEINESEAEKFEEDYFNWKYMQQWAATGVPSSAGILVKF